MKCINYLFKIFKSNFFILIVLVLILSSPFIYIYFQKFDIDFWNNVFSGFIATSFGLIAGIPIALWIDRFIKRQEEKKLYSQERKKESNILQLIKEEIDFSLNSLFVLNGKKGNTTAITLQPLKSDLWDALIAGQELKYIEDPKLLNRITSAYYVLKIVKNLEEQAHIALRTSAITFTTKDGRKENPAQQFIRDARAFDILFEDSCKEALKIINKRMDEINKLFK